MRTVRLHGSREGAMEGKPGPVPTEIELWTLALVSDIGCSKEALSVHLQVFVYLSCKAQNVFGEAGGKEREI
jgi:hypothetical protein